MLIIGGDYLPNMSRNYLTLFRTREVIGNTQQLNALSLAGYDRACEQLPGVGMPGGGGAAGYLEAWYYDQVQEPDRYQGKILYLVLCPQHRRASFPMFLGM